MLFGLLVVGFSTQRLLLFANVATSVVHAIGMLLRLRAA